MAEPINWIVAAQIPILILVLWFSTAYITQNFPTIVGKRILLLIAHPDDEAMFFAPSLLWLTRKDLGNQVLILCFSSGNADGLGEIRKKELQKSAVRLGITSEEHVVIIEDEKFPDSMTETWDDKLIGSILTRYFAPNIAKTPATAKPPASLDVIITFDSKGVSNHPNHIALHHGAIAFIRNLMARHTGWACPVEVYTLGSVNVVRKYLSFVDALWTMVTLLWQRRERGSFPTPVVTVSMPLGVWRAQMAMVRAHKSQMRWFRWGWIGLSRYMMVNELTKEKIGAEKKSGFERMFKLKK